jgi:hypothetical protein
MCQKIQTTIMQLKMNLMPLNEKALQTSGKIECNATRKVTGSIPVTEHTENQTERGMTKMETVLIITGFRILTISITKLKISQT